MEITFSRSLQMEVSISLIDEDKKAYQELAK